MTESGVPVELSPTAHARNGGTLLIIGGGEDEDGECTILREFVTLAGEDKARIVIIPVATSAPEKVGEKYSGLFEQCGARDIKVVDVPERDEANRPEALDALQQASGIFFTGGNQARITSILGGTKIEQLLHQRLAEGAVIAGTSAGAAIMPETMILLGEEQTNPKLGAVTLAPGMGFMSGVIVDQHFAERGRIGRLLSVIAEHPRHLGIGIDANTAIVVRDDHFEVIGGGAVTVLDAVQMTHTSLPSAEKNQSLAILGVTLHVLPAGYCFQLQHRTPVVKDNADEEE